VDAAGCDSIRPVPGVHGTSGGRDGAEEKMAAKVSEKLSLSEVGIDQNLADRERAWGSRTALRSEFDPPTYGVNSMLGGRGVNSGNLLIYNMERGKLSGVLGV
jgi:hypothetical protein